MKFSKIATILALFVFSISVQAATVPIEGHGSADIISNGGMTTVKMDSFSGADLEYSFLNSSAPIGINGGFADFDVTTGESLHFWYTDTSTNSTVNLYGSISSIVFDSVVQGFKVVALFGSGDIIDVAASLTPGGGESISLTANVSAVPVPAAVWLFGSGIMGLVTIAKRKKTSMI